MRSRAARALALALMSLSCALVLDQASAQVKLDPRLPVAYSPDGKLIAAGGADGKVRVWDTESNKLTRFVIRHSIKITAIAFTPDSKEVLASCEDGTVQLWTIEKGLLDTEASVANEVEPVTALALSNDGKRFLLASQNRAVHLFELVSNDVPHSDDKKHAPKLLRTFRRTAGTTVAVAFSPDGSRIAGGTTEKNVVVWETETKAEYAVLEGHKDTVTAVAFAPDGKRLLSGSLDGTLKMWELEKKGLQKSLTDAHEGGCVALVFSRDGKQVLSGGKNGWFKLWESDSLKFIKAFQGASPVLSLDLSPDGKRAVVSSADRKITVWDTVSGKPVATLPTETEK